MGMDALDKGMWHYVSHLMPCLSLWLSHFSSYFLFFDKFFFLLYLFIFINYYIWLDKMEQVSSNLTNVLGSNPVLGMQQC